MSELTEDERDLFYEHTDPSNSDASAGVLIEFTERRLAAARANACVVCTKSANDQRSRAEAAVAEVEVLRERVAAVTSCLDACESRLESSPDRVLSFWVRQVRAVLAEEGE